MDKRMVNGTVYMLVPETDGYYACSGCVGEGDDDLCSVLSEGCNYGVYVEAPKEEPVKETQSRYQIAKEVFEEFRSQSVVMTFSSFCEKMCARQSDPEYKEYLRLKEKFKE